jgi:hypothetical protein
VSPSAVVVALNPEECVLTDLGQIVSRAGMDEFFIVGHEERLGDRVVIALSGQSKIGSVFGPG